MALFHKRQPLFEMLDCLFWMLMVGGGGDARSMEIGDLALLLVRVWASRLQHEVRWTFVRAESCPEHLSRAVVEEKLKLKA